MPHRSYREESRIDWGTREGGTPLSLDQIQAGALLRIADASEKMAQNYQGLLDERNRLRRSISAVREDRNHLRHRIAGYKAAITRMKRQQGEGRP